MEQQRRRRDCQRSKSRKKRTEGEPRRRGRYMSLPFFFSPVFPLTQSDSAESSEIRVWYNTIHLGSSSASQSDTGLLSHGYRPGFCRRLLYWEGGGCRATPTSEVRAQGSGLGLGTDLLRVDRAYPTCHAQCQTIFLSNYGARRF